MYLFLCIATLFFVETDGNGGNLRFYFRNDLRDCQDPGLFTIDQGKEEKHIGHPMVTEFKCLANTHPKGKEGRVLSATRLERTDGIVHPYFRKLGRWTGVQYFDEVPFGIFEIPVARNSAEAKHWMGKETECYAKFIAPEEIYDLKKKQVNILISAPFKPVHIVGKNGEEFINRFVLTTLHENGKENVRIFKYPKIDSRVKSFYEPPYTFIEPIKLPKPAFNAYSEEYILEEEIRDYEVEDDYVDYKGFSPKMRYRAIFNSAVHHPRSALVFRDAKNEQFKYETKISIIGVNFVTNRVLNSIVDSFCFEKAGKNVFKVKIKKPEEKGHSSYEICIQSGEQKFVPNDLNCVVKLQNEMCYVYEDLSNAKAHPKHQHEPSNGTVEVLEKEGLYCSHYLFRIDEHNAKHYVYDRGMLDPKPEFIVGKN